MKKFLFLLAFLSGFTAYNQAIEISPSVSYLFGGRINYAQGDLKIVDKGAIGVNVGYDFGFEGGVEFSWVGTTTTANFNGIGLGYDDASFRIGVHHFQLGAYKDFGREKLKGFANFSLGATVFQPRDLDFGDEWKFSVSGTLGMKWFPLKFLGIKLYGRMILPMEFAGGGVWCGIGTGGAGCGVGVNTFAVLVQGDLGAGLIFRISTDSKKKSK